MTVSLLASGLIALSILSWLAVARSSATIRLLVGAGMFALTTAAVVKLIGSPLEPMFAAPGTALRLWHQLIVSSWWLLAARLVIEIGRLLVLRGALSREGRLFSDL